MSGLTDIVVGQSARTGAALRGRDVLNAPTFENLALQSTSIAQASAVAAYGLRRLFLRNMNPLVTVRRASDNATCSFYGIAGGGALMTANGSNGTSIAAWLGGSTGYVTQLWDQCGSNHLVEQAAGLGGTGTAPTLSNTFGGVFAVSFSSNGPGLVFATGSVPALSLAIAFSPTVPAAPSPSYNLLCGSNSTTSNLLLQLRGGSNLPLGRAGAAAAFDMGYSAAIGGTGAAGAVLGVAQPIASDASTTPGAWNALTMPTSGATAAPYDRIVRLGGSNGAAQGMHGHVAELALYSAGLPATDAALINAVPPAVTSVPASLAAALGPVALVNGNMGTLTFSAGAAYAASSVFVPSVAVYFKNLGATALTYSVSSNPYQNATVVSTGGALTLRNAGSGKTYAVVIQATNGTVSAYSTVTVVEPTAIAPVWTTATTLNPTDTTRNAADAKFDVFNYFPATDVMAIWPDIAISGGTITLPSATYGNVWCWLKTSFSSGINNTITSGLARTQLNYFSTVTNDYYRSIGVPSGYPICPEAGNSGNTVFSQQPNAVFYGANFQQMGGKYTRWGIVCNENALNDFSSSDVCGGIGLDSHASSRSAGDYFGCCGPQGINRSARVEMYVR